MQTRSFVALVIGFAALLSGTAHSALMVDSSGRGQVLIFPYYTVNGGEQTLLSIVNPTATGKAIKLRFRESLNGRETFALNLYLGRFDTWTAALIAGSDESPAQLLTRDSSCTVPRIDGSNSLPQLTNGTRYAPFSTAALTDGATKSPLRTREGYFEAIEMGTLVPGSASELAASQINGVPRDCASLATAWETGGYWANNPHTDMQAPSGDLSGGASIIHTALGTAYNAAPTVLSGFSVLSQHTAPNAELPDLSSAVTSADRQLVESVQIIAGKLIRSTWPQDRAIDAVSAVLMRANVRNEYDVSFSIGARSDWILTFPTKRHYADTALNGGIAIAPFTASFGSRSSACERITLITYDREERRPVGTITFPGAPVPINCICHSTARLIFHRLPEVSPTPYPPPDCSFSPVSLALGASGVFSNGSVNISASTDNHIMRPDLEGLTYLSLPVIGFWKLRYQDAANAAGQIRYYSESKPHRGNLLCNAANNQSCEPL